MAGATGDEARILKAGKRFTLLWSALLVGGAILFIPLSRGTTAVEVALGIASVVYGGLLGAFILGIRSERADQRSAAVGIVAGIAFVLWINARGGVAWPWFVPIGSVTTFLVGHALGRGGHGGASDDAPGSGGGAEEVAA
jgi:Na+/proline symporter